MDANNLTIGKALLVSLVGFLTVFVILLFIMLLIKLSARCINGKPSKAAEEAAPAPIPAEEKTDDNLEIIAVLSAAIAEYTKTSEESFVIRNIRKIELSGSEWISSARAENMK